MEKVNYGPAPPEIVALMEKLRRELSPEKRLLMVKLLSRTVATDGDDVEKATAAIVDQMITVFFKAKSGVEDT